MAVPFEAQLCSINRQTALLLCVIQDVFTVSVGNLPPHAHVLIKITYVAEVQVEGENVVFSVPGSVAPWKKDAALDEVTQVWHLTV